MTSLEKSLSEAAERANQLFDELHAAPEWKKGTQWWNDREEALAYEMRRCDELNAMVMAKKEEAITILDVLAQLRDLNA